MYDKKKMMMMKKKKKKNIKACAKCFVHVKSKYIK